MCLSQELWQNARVHRENARRKEGGETDGDGEETGSQAADSPFTRERAQRTAKRERPAVLDSY